MLKWITNLTYKIEELATKIRPFYHLAASYYEDVVKREASLASLSSQDHVLCIGGGICPFTAILFHQRTGAKVTVIDNNPECIQYANKIIKDKNLDKEIQVLCQDGCCCHSLGLREFSVVHLALQVAPMDKVFSQVEQQVKDGTKIMIRRPRKQLGHLYSQFLTKATGHLSFTTHGNKRNIGSTLLYVKGATT